jgi:hypothetical protein
MMMHDMVNMMGGMSWVMGLLGSLALVVLGIAALGNISSSAQGIMEAE